MLHHLLAPDTLALKRFGEQAARVNAKLYAALFPDARPVVAYLELEEIARELLIGDLARPDSVLHRALFTPVLREGLLRRLAGVRGCWSPCVASGGELPRTDPGQVGVALLALLAYALFAGGVGFLLGQLGIGEEAANAIANIGGMVLSFLGGAWVGLDMMPPAVLDVARFTPSYWTVTAIDGSIVELDSLGAALGAVGIVALFALAVVAAAVAVGRAKLREA